MVAQLSTPSWMSVQSYLEWEVSQPEKYEYIDGFVYAMVGGTLPHNRVAVNLIGLLNPHLRGGQCVTYSGDAKVAITKKGPFHYPDISVTCDDRDRSAREFLQYPCLIVEVLSPSTEAFDRGDKFKSYRRIETLTEYLLIHPDKLSVECHRLNDDGQWVLYDYSSSQVLELTSVGLSFSLEALYEGITFPGEQIL